MQLQGVGERRVIGLPTAGGQVMHGADDHGDSVLRQSVRHPPGVGAADQDDAQILGKSPVEGGVDLFLFRRVYEDGQFLFEYRDHRFPAEVRGMKGSAAAFGLLRDHVRPGFAEGVAKPGKGRFACLDLLLRAAQAGNVANAVGWPSNVKPHRCNQGHFLCGPSIHRDQSRETGDQTSARHGQGGQDTVGSGDREVLAVGIHGGHRADARGHVPCFDMVLGRPHRANLGEANGRRRGDQAGIHMFSRNVDHPGVLGKGQVGPNAGNDAGLEKHGGALDDAVAHRMDRSADQRDGLFLRSGRFLLGCRRFVDQGSEGESRNQQKKQQRNRGPFPPRTGSGFRRPVLPHGCAE